MKLEKHRLIRAVSRTISCSISESLLHFNSFLAVYCSILYSVQCCQYNCQCINNSATFKFKKDLTFSFLLLFRIVNFWHIFRIFCLNLHAYHIFWFLWNLRRRFEKQNLFIFRIAPFYTCSCVYTSQFFAKLLMLCTLLKNPTIYFLNMVWNKFQSIQYIPFTHIQINQVQNVHCSKSFKLMSVLYLWNKEKYHQHFKIF